MQISRTAEIHIFNSWGRDTPDILIVVRELDHLQLLLRTPYSGTGSVTLSKTEAVQIGTGITDLFSLTNRHEGPKLLGEGSFVHKDEVSGLMVSVKSINRCEPYEEGVCVEIGYESEHPVAFSIELPEYTGWEVGQLLQWD